MVHGAYRRSGNSRRRSDRRIGMTLVELLVVIGIMAILMAIALPLMKLGNEGRKVREVSRMLNAYVASARAKAAASGRPAGVMIQRGTNVHNGGYQVVFAESPRLFSGAWDESRARVVPDQRNPQLLHVQFIVPPYPGAGRAGRIVHDQLTVATLARALTDEYQSTEFSIKFNYQGAFYNAGMVPGSFDPQSRSADFLMLGDPTDDSDPVSRFHLLNEPLRYQVQLRPKAAVGEPFELPEGVMIDLGYSGFDQAGTEFNADPNLLARGPDFVNPAFSAGDPTRPPPSITIMFGPGGSLQRVYGAVNQGGVDLQPFHFVHLLVGKTEKTLATDDFEETNLADPESLWVSVVASTGNVVSSENAGLLRGDDGFAPAVTNPAGAAVQRAHARTIAQAATAMGGR